MTSEVTGSNPNYPCSHGEPIVALDIFPQEIWFRIFKIFHNDLPNLCAMALLGKWANPIVREINPYRPINHLFSKVPPAWKEHVSQEGRIVEVNSDFIVKRKVINTFYDHLIFLTASSKIVIPFGHSSFPGKIAYKKFEEVEIFLIHRDLKYLNILICQDDTINTIELEFRKNVYTLIPLSKEKFFVVYEENEENGRDVASLFSVSEQQCEKKKSWYYEDCFLVGSFIFFHEDNEDKFKAFNWKTEEVFSFSFQVMQKNHKKYLKKGRNFEQFCRRELVKYTKEQYTGEQIDTFAAEEKEKTPYAIEIHKLLSELKGGYHRTSIGYRQNCDEQCVCLANTYSASSSGKHFLIRACEDQTESLSGSFLPKGIKRPDDKGHPYLIYKEFLITETITIYTNSLNIYRIYDLYSEKKLSTVSTKANPILVNDVLIYSYAEKIYFLHLPSLRSRSLPLPELNGGYIKKISALSDAHRLRLFVTSNDYRMFELEVDLETVERNQYTLPDPPVPETPEENLLPPSAEPPLRQNESSTTFSFNLETVEKVLLVSGILFTLVVLATGTIGFILSSRSVVWLACPAGVLLVGGIGFTSAIFYVRHSRLS